MHPMSSAATPHPSWIWACVVTALVGLCVWVALTRDAPTSDAPQREAEPAPVATPTAQAQEAAGAAPGAANNSGKVAKPSAGGSGFGGGAASSPAAADDHAPELGGEPGEPASGDVTAQLATARRALAERRFAAARRSALECLKVEPGNAECAKARVHSYTQQYPLSETSEIVRWCLSPFASDLNCLRQLRVFHQSKGEAMDASGISVEIRTRFPDANLELPSSPDEGE